MYQSWNTALLRPCCRSLLCAEFPRHLHLFWHIIRFPLCTVLPSMKQGETVARHGRHSTYRSQHSENASCSTWMPHPMGEISRSKKPPLFVLVNKSHWWGKSKFCTTFNALPYFPPLFPLFLDTFIRSLAPYEFFQYGRWLDVRHLWHTILTALKSLHSSLLLKKKKDTIVSVYDGILQIFSSDVWR